MHRLLVSTFFLMAVCGCGADVEHDVGFERPNVVLVIVDTLRKDRLSCYGHDRATSPNIDALAADGVLYRHAQSQAPWTKPSVGSLLTSQYPSYLGLVREEAGLHDDVLTLPEALREAGYRTGAVVSNQNLTAASRFDQGFELFDESNVLGPKAITSGDVTRSALRVLDGLLGGGSTGGPLAEPAQERRPFFLWVHYFDPHISYFEHDAHRFPGGEDYSGPIRSGMAFERYMKKRPLLRKSESDLEQAKRYYDSEIAFTDEHVGVLLERLRALDLYDDTLVVFTSDHGEEFMDHGDLGHTKNLFSELIEVPLVIKYPDGRHGTNDEYVALLDIYPTVLDVARVPVPAGLAGRSLLGSDSGPERPIFSETSRFRDLRAVLQGGHKLVHDLERQTWSLYDLEADPAERSNVAAREPETLGRLRGELRRWMADHAEPSVAADPVELSEEERETLRALGYLDAQD